MADKVDDLLDFSRAGRSIPEGSFHLKTAVLEGKRALTRKFQETDGGIRIIGELPEVEGDPSMVAQIFQNLFSNSLKYRSDEKPTITVQATLEKGMWRVSVSDNGIGFDSKQFGERIFGVFQRLHTVEDYPGTGIGLAITKKIIERHGGNVWTESTPNRGATFHFTLPPKP